jgi:hypothetical protein
MLGGASGLGLLFSLTTGLAMDDFSDAPLTKSTSPSDFWGRRWDRPVASALKRGAFRPLRDAGFSRNAASLLTFALSGLIHEYVLYFMSLRKRSGVGEDPSYIYSQSPTRGRQGLFFVINGLLLVAERFLETKSDLPIVKMVMKNIARLPRAVRTMLVLLLVLPVGHWFTDEYIQSSFFADAAFGFPIVNVRVGSV